MGQSCACRCDNKGEKDLKIDLTNPFFLAKIVKIQNIFRGFRYRKTNLYSLSLKLSRHPHKTSSTNSLSFLSKLSTTTSIIPIETLNNVFKKFPLNEQLKSIKLSVRPPQEYNNKSVYLGEWNDVTNRRHGRGVLRWSDGAIYEGYWIDDKINIYGKLTLSNGDFYEGEWKDDKANGYGTYTKKNGDSYTGYWINDKQNGEGTEIFPDGSVYKGLYANGMKNGKGRIKWKEGAMYEGEFVNNNIEGRGVYKWKNKNTYTGEWKDNKMNGKGVFTWADGRRYEGEFKDDKREGYGEHFWPDGSKYKGNWVNGFQEGKGSCYNPETKNWIEGTWKKGKRLK